jgi:peroxiredoxin
LKDKKVILFGLPGAYTSVCSAKHLPGYVSNYDNYKAKEIDHIICISANDPFVMDAWGKSHNVGNKLIMIGDPFLNFTKSIGAEVDKSARGLGIRSNRYTMLIDNLKVVKL